MRIGETTTRLASGAVQGHFCLQVPFNSLVKADFGGHPRGLTRFRFRLEHMPKRLCRLKWHPNCDLICSWRPAPIDGIRILAKADAERNSASFCRQRLRSLHPARPYALMGVFRTFVALDSRELTLSLLG